MLLTVSVKYFKRLKRLYEPLWTEVRFSAKFDGASIFCGKIEQLLVLSENATVTVLK